MTSTTETKNSWHGACACGAVQYTMNDDNLTEAHVCHCTTCQAWSGGIYVYVESKQVQVTQGAEVLKTWNSTDFCQRQFCSTCGSTILCRLLMPEGSPMHGMVHVSAGTLKNWKGLSLTKEIFIDRKPSGFELRAGDGTKAACQMTKRECYTAWGVPLDDEDDAKDGTEVAGSKRKLEPEGSK